MRQLQTEVLVVGAGPVGMFTALRLAEFGIRTHSLTGNPARRDTATRAPCIRAP